MKDSDKQGSDHQHKSQPPLMEITIPVLDEELTLRSKTEKALDYLKKSAIPAYKITIADNGSTDKTPEIGKSLENENPGVVRFLKVSKRGVGLALRTSWSQSKSEIVGYMDLDLATDLKHLEEAYKILTKGKYQIVNGTRLHPEAKVINRSLLREITSRGFNFIVRLILGVQIRDGMCGFKFFQRQVAQSLIESGITTDGWIFSTEILVKAEWANYKIFELPIHWTDDRSSKANIPRLSQQYLKKILKLRKEKSAFISKNKGR